MDLSALIMQLQKKRDDKIFRILFETFYHQAYQTAYLITRDEYLAKDATQEAFIKIFTSLHQLMEPNKFRSWLMTIVSNKAVDILKSRKRLLITEDVENIISLNKYKDGINLTEAEVERKEEKKILLNTVLSLPLHYRQVVVLKYFCELKAEEIAKELAIKEGTVKSRLNRARLILKYKLNAVKEFMEEEVEGGGQL